MNQYHLEYHYVRLFVLESKMLLRVSYSLYFSKHQSLKEMLIALQVQLTFLQTSD